MRARPPSTRAGFRDLAGRKSNRATGVMLQLQTETLPGREMQREALWYTRFSMNRRDVVTVHQYRYTVLFEPAEEGGYVVTCPSLPGLVTEGDTLEEARDMAEDALRGYLESLREDGLSIPPDKTPITEPIEIALAS